MLGEHVHGKDFFFCIDLILSCHNFQKSFPISLFFFFLSFFHSFFSLSLSYVHTYALTLSSPPLPPTAESEYPAGPEVSEVADPTREEEAAVEAAQAQALEEAEAAEEEGEEED